MEIGADDLCLTCASNINSYLSRELTGMGVASLENKVMFYKLLTCLVLIFFMVVDPFSDPSLP